MSHSLQPIVLSSDREEAAEEKMELTVPASPPKTAAPRQVPSSTQVAEAVTNLVIQVRRTGASMSTVTSISVTVKPVDPPQEISRRSGSPE